MADAPDHLLELADGLVAAINAASQASGFSTQCQAEWQDDPSVELSDAALRSTIVWVVDIGETRELDRDRIGVEDSAVLVVVQRKLDSTKDLKTQCRELSLLTSELIRFCWDTMIAVDGDGSSCFRIERAFARDFGDYAANGRYYSEFVVSYRRVTG